MKDNSVLIKEINKIPPQYLGEVFKFIENLQQKVHKMDINDIDEYKAMAADAEREQEAKEWCGAYFGPVVNP